MKAVAAIVALVLLTACGGWRPRGSGGCESSASAGTWGHLGGGEPRWLAQLAPGSTISVCGVEAADAVSSIRDWAEVVQRDSGLTVDDRCDRDADRVVTINDSSNAAVKQVCDGRPEAAGLALVDYGVILLCVPDHRSQILLHEVGHLWGLCDVYPLEDGMADNCDPLYFTGRSRDSVMGASYGNGLTSADRAGLRQLAARDDVDGNQLWSQTAPADTGQAFDLLQSPPSSVSAASRFMSPTSPDVLTANDLPVGLIDALTTF